MASLASVKCQMASVRCIYFIAGYQTLKLRQYELMNNMVVSACYVTPGCVSGQLQLGCRQTGRGKWGRGYKVLSFVPDSFFVYPGLHNILVYIDFNVLVHFDVKFLGPKVLET